MESRESPEKSPLLLVDVCPGLVGEVAALLRDSRPGDPIADSISGLPFHGICRNYVLTAPEGTPSPWVIALEREAETVFLLGVDPSQSVVTWVDVLDGRDPPPAVPL
ncbi:hypothetical protein OG594_19010 [Streptomyces sp. NBC_01214]|uniref:hypothetical protein n=1 Tax=Streptomyces sp. NBC_01214 TaxID=2903777 RepID=UPI002255DD32|nr:hypothetical protein [Streptomyces sp. NBC_01214]MCX4803711.1 hypothetical protein [Streptomyces sp. NBC_01214]